MSAKPTVLVAFKIRDALRSRLEARCDVLGSTATAFADRVSSLSPEDAARVHAVITMGTLGISREQIGKLPNLGLVLCYGSGYEAVDLEAARERRIVVGHSPGANASTVADLAIGLMIASIREMFAANAYLLRGEWLRSGRRRAEARGLTGRRVGIYGLGAIGAKVAERCAALEMEIGYHNRRRRDDAPYPYFGTLLELATWADVLMIAVRAGAANRHAVDASVLRALGADGHVVNISRGSVIDEAALIAALQDGTIAGAGLDVYEREPMVPEALRALTNVALTPHIGGDALEAQEAMGRMVLANVDAFFAGQPIPTPVPESPAIF